LLRPRLELNRELIERIRDALSDGLLTAANHRATVTDGCAILRYSRLTLSAPAKRRCRGG
jgi:hypothetical protein